MSPSFECVVDRTLAVGSPHRIGSPDA